MGSGGDEELPPGPDVSEPFPIDRGDEGTHTPGTYKGLPLRLIDNGEPQVTPVDGVVGVACVGMSNGRQECNALIAGLEGPWADEVRDQVRVANCAVGAHAIERWNDPAFDDRLWELCVDTRLSLAGIRVDQVRVLLHKAANQFTATPDGEQLPPYPEPGNDFAVFYDNLGVFADRVTDWFPAVQAVYTSSRSYGGFANRPWRGEPLSYEEGHALNRWLRDNPSVDGVWYGWGAYLWAGECGTDLHNGSGVCYQRLDYESDGIHPSPAGEVKIARLMHDRFRQEAWYGR